MAAVPAAAGARAAAQKVGGKAAAAAGSVPSKGKGDLPQRGDWRQRSKEVGPKKGGTSKAFQGAAGNYRRALIAEFVVCVLLLGLSPLAKGSGEMGPVRFMKRGSATCALFVILGLLSSAGRGAARAGAAFGGLVTLVLLVDQREAFGKLATIIAGTDDDDVDQTAAGAGPDETTEEPAVADT